MSCADVCIDMDVDGSNQFYAAKVQTARKPHKCCECFRQIAVGEQYEYARGKDYDYCEFWDTHTCFECYEIRRALVCGGFYSGQLWEEIEQNVFPAWLQTSPIDCLAQIDSLAARDKLRAEFAKWRVEGAQEQ